MTRRSDGIGFLTMTIGWGGAEVHTVAVARALEARGRGSVILQLGHEVYSAPERAVAGPGVRVVPVPLHGVRTPGFWRALLDRHDLGTVVLVKGGHMVRWASLDLAMLLRPVRYLRIEHSQPPQPEVWKPGRHLGGLVPGLGLWYVRLRAGLWLHRVATGRIIAVSYGIRQRLVDLYHYRPDDITVIHNGVDTSRFVADAAAAERARARWNVPPGAYVVGTVARLARPKRLDRLLAAFKLFSERAPNAFLVVIGEGPDEEALRELAGQLGLADRCHWAGGSGDSSLEYPGFDCFTVTSEAEGLSYALLEAMACERMVVAMEAPGIDEVLAEPGIGRLVPADIEACAAALFEVRAASPERRAEMGARARRHVQEHHEARHQVGAVCSLILAPEP